jgi:hypothetical protein
MASIGAESVAESIAESIAESVTVQEFLHVEIHLIARMQRWMGAIGTHNS